MIPLQVAQVWCLVREILTPRGTPPPKKKPQEEEEIMPLTCLVQSLVQRDSGSSSISAENLAPHFCPLQPLKMIWGSRDPGSYPTHPHVGRLNHGVAVLLGSRP